MFKKPQHNRVTRKLTLTPKPALSRACQIDRAADALLAIGRVAAAERLAHLAAALREGAR